MPNFKKKQPKTDKFKHTPTDSRISMPDHKHPIFCFRYLQADHDFEKCEADEKRQFLEQMMRLSKMTWEEINLAPRHGLGSEKISMASIKPKCPDFITDDVNYLLALRFDGKKPFLVHRDRFIAHVIFIDNKFSVYNH